VRRAVGALALLALLPWQSALAHPHVFIAWRIEPIVENGAITAVKLHWQFDDLYSDLVLGTVDRDRDRKLSQPEIDALQARTLANLEKVKFYAHFSLDGQAWEAEKAEQFTAAVEGDNVNYTFTLKLSKPVKTVSTYSLDPDYYIEMRADKRQATTGAGFVCSFGPSEPVKTQNWGSLIPDKVDCKTP
jgi:ABC-type uncharacterized transport system substrate-binding protein